MNLSFLRGLLVAIFLIFSILAIYASFTIQKIFVNSQTYLVQQSSGAPISFAIIASTALVLYIYTLFHPKSLDK